MRLTRRKVAAMNLLFFSFLEWQMAMLKLGAAEVDAAGSDFSDDDDYGSRTFGRVRYFSVSSMSMLQLLGFVLCQDGFSRALTLLRRGRRFWAAPRGVGVWETQFLSSFRVVGRLFPDWEDEQYLQHFRMR